MANRIVIGSMAAALAIVAFASAQSQGDQPRAFEVVSIKKFVLPPGAAVLRMKSDDPKDRALKPEGNRFRTIGGLSDLVVYAYDVHDYQVSGLPKWAQADDDLYIIDAKAEGEGVSTSDQLREMLRTMLAERFQLTLHRDTKEMAVYDLVVGKNGLKMKEVGPDDTEEKPLPQESTYRARPTSGGKVIQTGIGFFVMSTSFFLDHPIIDKTGLKGRYEYVWDPTDLWDEVRKDGKPAPSIFSRVQEYGLKLEPTKGPVEVLVIDHAEKPSEN